MSTIAKHYEYPPIGTKENEARNDAALSVRADGSVSDNSNIILPRSTADKSTKRNTEVPEDQILANKIETGNRGTEQLNKRGAKFTLLTPHRTTEPGGPAGSTMDSKKVGYKCDLKRRESSRTRKRLPNSIAEQRGELDSQKSTFTKEDRVDGIPKPESFETSNDSLKNLWRRPMSSYLSSYCTTLATVQEEEPSSLAQDESHATRPLATFQPFHPSPEEYKDRDEDDDTCLEYGIAHRPTVGCEWESCNEVDQDDSWNEGLDVSVDEHRTKEQNGLHRYFCLIYVTLLALCVIFVGLIVLGATYLIMERVNDKDSKQALAGTPSPTLSPT